MLWLFAGIAILWFAVASRGFRRVLAILAGIAVVGIALLLAFLKVEENAQKREAEAAKLRIPRTNVELVDLRMGTDSPFVKLTGRVRNKDPQFTLTGIELRLRVQECPPITDAVKEKILKNAPDGLSEDAFNRFLDSELEKAGARCETVGDTIENIAVNVPPQQTREIEDYVSFSGIGSARMKRTWFYDVVSMSGRSPAH